MTLKWKELELVLGEARPYLEGGSIQKIYQTEALAGGESFVFHGYNSQTGGFRLWASLFQDKTCLTLLGDEQKPDAAKEASTFVMVLRKHLLGLPIMRVEQLVHDRMAVLHFAEGKALLVILIPRRANILLLEDWDEEKRQAKCIASFQRATLKPGAIYELPSAPLAMPKPEVREELLNIEGINAKVAEIYSSNLEESHFQTRKNAWRASFKSSRKKMATALENTKRDLEQAQEAELFQWRGKALFARLYELGPKSLPKEKSITLDYEDEGGVRSVEIPLDKSRSYSENAELCFKKAKKFTRAVGELDEILKDHTAKLERMDLAGKCLEESASDDDFVKCEELFRAAGIPVPDLAAKEKTTDEAKLCLEFLSSDGFRILCGRNQEENRQVTFKECRGNDLWMHVKGVPGAHVAILSQKNKTVPLNTLLEAAQATLYHTKIRDGRKAEVDYTFRKYVKPIKGTLAEVTYTENKTLNVEASSEEYRKLVSRK